MSCDILFKENITDKEFLEFMIRHHNVAIKMSQLIQMNSQDDYIQHYARKVIYNQSLEVKLMEKLLESLPNVQNEKSCRQDRSLISGRIDELYPGIFSNAKCDNSHFEDIGNTPVQLKEMTHHKVLSEDVKMNHHINDNHLLTDKDYVDHMISHHQSGLDLSKLVLKSTQEPRIFMLAQNIILDQEKEMFELSHLLNCTKFSWRK